MISCLFVNHFLHGFFNQNIEQRDIDKLYRLGRWSEDKIRPLLVVFKDAGMKENITVNLKKLKSTGDKLRGVSVSHDLHPKERKGTKP